MARKLKEHQKDLEKYNLSKSDLKIAKANDINRVNDIAGKQVTNTVQILKRLFSSPYVVIATVILLIIMLTAFIVPLVSPYGEITPISKAKISFISFLLPSWFGNGFNAKEITGINDPFVKDLINAGIIDGASARDFIIIGENGSMQIRFNPWNFLNAVDNMHHLAILGTDSVGRDIWTRLWIGTRQSILLAFLVAIIEAIIGVIVGAYIGFHAGGKIDNFAMRIIDIITSVPSLIWFVLLMFVLPASFWTMFLALVIVGWTVPVQRTRMFIIKVKDAEYVRAAESIGVTQTGLIFKHALPNIVGKLITGIVVRVPLVIFIEASLAFLGFTSSENASLGNLINDAKGYIEYWWYLLAPTIVILLITVSLQIIGNGLHDAFDPSTTR